MGQWQFERRRGLGRFGILHHQRPRENEEKHVKLIRTEGRPPQDSNTVRTEKWSVASTLVCSVFPCQLRENNLQQPTLYLLSCTNLIIKCPIIMAHPQLRSISKHKADN